MSQKIFKRFKNISEKSSESQADSIQGNKMVVSLAQNQDEQEDFSIDEILKLSQTQLEELVFKYES